MPIATFKPMGIIKDLPAHEIDEKSWSNGKNVVFRLKGASSPDGYSEYAAGAILTPRYLLGNRQPNLFYWLYAANDGIAVTDSNTHNNITPAAGYVNSSGQNAWTGGSLNGVPFLNNGKMPPVYWDGQVGNRMLALPGWPAATLCKALRPYKYNLIAMNLTQSGVQYDQQLMWSAAADPGNIPNSWTPLPTNDAGDNPLASTPGAIVDGMPLRDNFMVYKQHSTYILQYVGGNYVFVPRKQFVTVGALARNCIAESKGKHIVLTDGDLVHTDGQNIESLIDNRWRKTLFNTLDPDNFEECFVASSPSTDEIIVGYPEVGASTPNKALVYNTLYNEIGIVDLPDVSHIARGIIQEITTPIVWNADTEKWKDDLSVWNQQLYKPTEDSMLMADVTNDKFWHLGGADTYGGQVIDCFIEKGSYDFEDPNTVKLVTRIWPKITGTPGQVIKVRVGGQMYPGESVTWSSEIDYTIGSDSHIDVMVSGRYISVNFQLYTEYPSRIDSYDVEYQNRGRW